MKSVLAVATILTLFAATVSPARADDYAFKRTLDFTAQPAGASSIGVAGYNGNIHLYADGGSTIRVHAVLGARSEEALRALDVRTSRQDGTLRIADVCPDRRRLVFWSFADCDIRLDVRYPRSMAVSVHSENGNVVIQGSSAAVSVDNGNGNVEVNGAGGPVSVKNANGNLRILGAPANVSASDRNGNVRVSLAPNWRGSAIALHTNAGNVHLAVPANFAASYTAKVTLGSVENHARVRQGPAKVTATTTFGNVVISQE